jgi:hypothetical protein
MLWCNAAGRPDDPILFAPGRLVKIAHSSGKNFQTGAIGERRR